MINHDIYQWTQRKAFLLQLSFDPNICHRSPDMIYAIQNSCDSNHYGMNDELYHTLWSSPMDSLGSQPNHSLTKELLLFIIISLINKEEML